MPPKAMTLNYAHSSIQAVHTSVSCRAYIALATAYHVLYNHSDPRITVPLLPHVYQIPYHRKDI